jgi:hypothetical protein
MVAMISLAKFQIQIQLLLTRLRHLPHCLPNPQVGQDLLAPTEHGIELVTPLEGLYVTTHGSLGDTSTPKDFEGKKGVSFRPDRIDRQGGEGNEFTLDGVVRDVVCHPGGVPFQESDLAREEVRLLCITD